MHTETNVLDPVTAPQWLWKQWVNVLRVRRDGIPVLGFTWYSLIDQAGLARQAEVSEVCLQQHLYSLEATPAVQHLFRVASRLDSMRPAKSRTGSQDELR